MLTLVAALVLGQQSIVSYSKTLLPNPFGKLSRLMVQFDPENRLPRPQLSPKKFGLGEDRQPFEFDFSTFGLAHIDGDDTTLHCRFRVYEQERKQKNDVAFAVTEMLLRLWEYNYNRLKLDHSPLYDDQMVDVYLCWGGTAGGEQLFDIDPSLARNQKVNTIYIYDLPSFTDPVEMAREVAHEYGHASLPAIGGFNTPEDWGNGYLGERLFLTYLRDELAKDELKPQDAMGATAPELDKWVQKNVDPLVVASASSAPDLNVLGGTGPKAMNAYMGLMLYCSQLLPPTVFQRSLRLTGSQSAKDIPDAVVMAVEEPDTFTMKVPKILAGKAIWIPVSKARIEGASVISSKRGWALVKPTGSTITLKNQPPGTH